MRIIEIDSQDPRWYAFANHHPGALIYHHPAWLHVLEAEYGQDSLCLACEDAAGAIRGILPLVWTKGLPVGPTVRTGRRLSSLPRTPVAGPLSTHEHATTALVGAAIDLVRDRPGTRLEMKPSAPFSVDATGGLTPVRRASSDSELRATALASSGRFAKRPASTLGSARQKHVRTFGAGTSFTWKPCAPTRRHLARFACSK